MGADELNRTGLLWTGIQIIKPRTSTRHFNMKRHRGTESFCTQSPTAVQLFSSWHPNGPKAGPDFSAILICVNFQWTRKFAMIDTPMLWGYRRSFYLLFNLKSLSKQQSAMPPGRVCSRNTTPAWVYMHGCNSGGDWTARGACVRTQHKNAWSITS